MNNKKKSAKQFAKQFKNKHNSKTQAEFLKWLNK